MKKRLFFLLTVLIVTGFTGPATASPYYVWVDASQTKNGGDGIADNIITLQPSEEAWLDVFISDIPSDGLISAGLYLTFDPDQLELKPGTTFFDPPWADLLTTIEYNNTDGYLNFEGGSLPELTAGTVSLFTIELQCKGPGTSLLDFNLHGGMIDDFVTSTFSVLDPDVVLPAVQVINTPIPSTLLLLGTGLGVLFFGFRRKERN